MIAALIGNFVSTLLPRPDPKLADEKMRAHLDSERRQRLRKNFHFLRVLGVANAGIVAIIGNIAIHDLRTEGWIVCFLLLLGLRAVARRLFPEPASLEKSCEGMSRRSTIALFAGAVIWASVPVVIFPIAGPEMRLFVACLACGTMAVNGLFLYMVPRHAVATILIIAAGCFIGLIGSWRMADLAVAAMLASYTYSLLFGVGQISENFAKAAIRRFELQRSKELFRVLFRDFEDTSSDWMWSVDRHGRLNHISPQFLKDERLAGFSLEPAAVLRSLKDPAVPEDKRSAAAMPQVLHHALKERLPFREVVVAVCLQGEWRYWRVSGRPVFDSEHEYLGMRGSCSDITDIYLAERRLHYLALNDPLTGLANRASFERELETFIRSVYEDECEFVLMSIDLDKFKIVNDRLGQQAGDEVLREISRRLRVVCPYNSCIARFGGDEFCVLISAAPGHGEQQGVDVAKRIISVMAEPIRVLTELVGLNCSIGLAVAPRDGLDRTSIHRNADLALYRAKLDAVSSFRVFAPDMDAAARKAQELEFELRTALQRGEFELNYQPLADGPTGRVVGYETLLRWNSEKFGRVPPDEFIRIAERSGMIGSIGEWVLRQACHDAARWPSELFVAINLSPQQLAGFSLLSLLPNALGESGLAAGRLELEITETALEEDPEHVTHILRCVREMGISVALDDFGTGYSSLSHLVRFPFDKLKIDKSFIAEAMVSEQAMGVIRAIVSLARTLEVKITAEGVETEAQYDMLTDLGVDEMQGYLIARPRPVNELPLRPAMRNAS